MKKIIILAILLSSMAISAMEKRNLNVNNLLVDSARPASLKLISALKLASSEQNIMPNQLPEELSELIVLIKLLLSNFIFHTEKKILVNIINNPDIDLYFKNIFVYHCYEGENSKQKILNALLQMSINYRNIALARLALKLGADINSKDDLGNTTLMWAAGYGVKEIVELLLNQGADVNSQCAEGSTALMNARSKEIVQMLLAYGADPRIKDIYQNAALNYAVMRRHESVEILLKAGADINAIDAARRTALMVAAQLGQAETVKTLLAYGADRGITIDGDTALDLAKRAARRAKDINKYKEIIKLLSE